MLRTLLTFAGALALAACSATDAAEPPPHAGLAPDELGAIAEEAFVYGYPLVVGYGVLYEYAVDEEAEQYKAPFNQLYNTARVYTPADTAVVTPNSDTPYSFVWADLRREPLVLHVPEVEAERYYSAQLVDLYTFNYGYIGSRTTGNGAGRYLIAGPGWEGETPEGIDGVFRCETGFSFVILRTQLFGPDDLRNVERVQHGYRVEPLSSYLVKDPPERSRWVEWIPFDKQRAQEDPFSYIAFLLQFCPPEGPAEVEAPLRERFARMGLIAGEPFSMDDFDDAQKAAIEDGVKRGLARIQGRVAGVGRAENGWRLGSAAGDRAFYDGDWGLRAAGAMAGIYGNSQAEAFYPFLVADAAGEKPDASQHDYTLTFAADALPPVHAFWSITMYDARTQFLIENPIQRYLVNSPMLPDLARNADGSLTLYLQKDSPGADKESNWLPAPDGPMFVVMRLYWPEAEAMDGSWAPPPLVPAGGSTSSADARPEVERRRGDKSLETVVLTDARYGGDPLFQGPRGWTYWNGLEDPRPIQNPNLWPAKQSTYFLSQFELPAGAELTWRFDFPHARYFQYALYRAEEGTFVSIGEAFSGADLEPDEGSVNPFRVGAGRRSEERACTLRVVAEDAPADPSDRERNTLYAGRDGGLLQGVARIYLSDPGWDGAGWARVPGPADDGGFRYEGRLADGTALSRAEVGQRFARPIEGNTAQPLDADGWVALVSSPKNDPALDPATSPAREEPRWEKYWNIKYSILGSFLPAEARARIPFAGAMDGGGDPTTQYFFTHVSRRFGPVYVVRGKMPTFPDTWGGTDGGPLEVQPDAQVQFWSMVSGEAVPSGHIVDGICDMQVPLDDERNYTIVVSRAEDRPANATPENGVAWLEWSPRGEGLDDPRNRADFGMLMIRVMGTNPTWAERPEGITEPGMEESVMGPYLPRGEYTDKAAFEALGSGAAS